MAAAASRSSKMVTGAVAKLRWLMLGLIAVLMATVAVTLLLNREDDRLRLSYSSLVHKSGNLPPVMMRPRLQGVDSQGQPFQVMASEATQPDADSVVLQQVEADISLRDGTWLALKADFGDLDMPASLLQLNKNVMLFHQEGYEFTTDRAIVEMEQATAWGDKPVLVNGPLGTLKATGFHVTQTPQRMRFEGRVQLTLYPGAQTQ